MTCEHCGNQELQYEDGILVPTCLIRVCGRRFENLKADLEKLRNPAVGQLLPNGLVAITQAACEDLVKCDRYKAALDHASKCSLFVKVREITRDWDDAEVAKINICFGCRDALILLRTKTP